MSFEGLILAAAACAVSRGSPQGRVFLRYPRAGRPDFFVPGRTPRFDAHQGPHGRKRYRRPVPYGPVPWSERPCEGVQDRPVLLFESENRAQPEEEG